MSQCPSLQPARHRIVLHSISSAALLSQRSECRAKRPTIHLNTGDVWHLVANHRSDVIRMIWLAVASRLIDIIWLA